MTEPTSSLLQAVDHVQLAIPVGSENAARDYWVGVLGLTEVPKPESMAARGGAWFETDGVVVHVGAEAAFVPALKAHPAFRVVQIDQLAARLTEAGYPVKWDEEIPDVRRFHSADPFGNRVEFISG